MSFQNQCLLISKCNGSQILCILVTDSVISRSHHPKFPIIPMIMFHNFRLLISCNHDYSVVLFRKAKLRFIAPLLQQSASYFRGAKRILWPQKYNLLGSNCKPKSTKKRIVSPLFSSSLYQGLTDQDTCCSCCWYLCSSDSAVVVTLHIDMFSLSCRVLDIQGCNTLCVHVTQVLDSLVYGFGVLWADGYKYKVVYSSRFFGYRYDGL